MFHTYKKHFTPLLLFFCIPLFSSLAALEVQNGNKFFIEKISVEGNSKTRLNVIYENLGFSTGDSLTEDQINAGIENLTGAWNFGPYNQSLFITKAIHPGCLLIMRQP